MASPHPFAPAGADDRARRILVAAPFPPRLDGRHGGSRAVAQLLAGLSARHHVALLVLRAHDEPGVDDALQDACDLVEEVAIPFFGDSLPARGSRWLRSRTAPLRGVPGWAVQRSVPRFSALLARLVDEWRPDVLQLEYRIMGQFLSEPGGGPPRILVEHDPEESEGSHSFPLSRFESRAWTSLGRAAARRVDAIVVLTGRDRQTVSALGGATRIECIPLSYAVPPVPLDPAGTEPGSVVCVGSFIHPPNIDAALWLAREIFPPVRAHLHEASLRLVGSHAPAEIRLLSGAGVTVSPDVPDVHPYLEAASVVAAPVRQGGGMRVKVLEALAGGKAVVATPLALEGLDLRDGKEVVVATTAGEFADAIVALLGDEPRRRAIGTAARRWAEHTLGIDSQVRAYEALYETLVGADRHTGVASAVRG